MMSHYDFMPWVNIIAAPNSRLAGGIIMNGRCVHAENRIKHFVGRRAMPHHDGIAHERDILCDVCKHINRVWQYKRLNVLISFHCSQ